MTTQDRGYVALLSLIIVGAVVLALVVGASARSVGEARMSLGQQESHRALALANLCAERALFKLESVLNYAGDETLAIGADTCVIRPIGGSGNLNRTVEAYSTVSDYTKKVKADVTQISPSLQVGSWQEVADF
ncbi:hypothetical protein HY633_04510 [Candidatus Uhrbacteria bacterium]|nr:hypothetical protein [Candidatus Uhrbacteria bacterium]